MKLYEKYKHLLPLKETVTPWGEIGYLVYKRTYARKLKDTPGSEETEEYFNTVLRVIDACRTQLKVGFTEAEEYEFAKYLLELKGSVAGRFLWQLGTKTVEKLGLPSLQNCAAVIVNEPVRPFTWTMEMLMLGSGVGFNIQREFVYKMPRLINKKIKITRLDSSDADFIVPDTREGWVQLLEKTLKSHFYSGKSFTYSTQLIRSAGAPIKGFGGTASGPEILCDGIEKINEVLNKRVGKNLRPIDCLDIMNIIGSIVVAGNVRRSAQIAIGDFDDIEFLKAKRWDLGEIPNWRSMSNNSIAIDDINLAPQEFWDTYEVGEAYGIINLALARSCGRLGETQYPDESVSIFNPCGEQGLESNETCCLAEVFLPNVESLEQLKRVITLLYRVNKHSLALPCSIQETEDIVHKNMRMGIGLTGIFMCLDKIEWLDEAYRYLREYDVDYSQRMGWPVSIKLTTVKPSGSLSLLAGVTPGIHPSPAGPYYIRRVRIGASNHLAKLCKEHSYNVEYAIGFNGDLDYTTYVVDFPCKLPEETIIEGDISAIEHLGYVKKLQEVWSDNSVSCSVYYKKEELPAIKQYLSENFSSSHKTLSFLLSMGAHGFKQAPYETISKEVYEEMVSRVKPLGNLNAREEDFDIDDCSTGACPIK